MPNFDDRARALLSLYAEEARPTITALGAPELPDIDAAAALLERALSTDPTVRVGFLGESQVGKSSIINALVDQRVLPSGGVGPLTAQATTLGYDESPHLRVRYHGRRRLAIFRLSLQRYLELLGELATSPGDAWDGPGEDEGDNGPVGLLETSQPDDERSEGEHDPRRAVGEHLVSQARLLFDAPSSTTRVALFQLVRAATAKVFDPLSVPSEFRARIGQIRNLLDTAEEIRRQGPEDKEFRSALRQRAAGWLSPLVAELHVRLDLPLLREAEVVDLPGVGVVGDPAGRVAEAFVRTRADVLTIVMRNNGLTDAIANLLEKTGVISRLLWATRSEEPSIHVAILVTRLDDVAKDAWRQRVRDAKEEGEPPPSREAVFGELSRQMEDTVRRQIADALCRSREFDDLSPDMRSQRERVVRGLCDAMTVLCVSAPDYLGLLEGFEDDCFLRNREATNIPRLVGRIRELAGKAQSARDRRLTDAYCNFVELLSETLNKQEYLRRDRQRTIGDADDQFREALEQAVEPLRERAKQNRRDFHGVLWNVIPGRLEVISDYAADRARTRLRKLTKDSASLRWATLNAALVRNGTFSGAAEVDYPGALTRAFVDVIAGSWEQVVIEEVRRSFRTLCTADAEVLEEVTEHAARLLAEQTGSEDLVAKIQVLKQKAREQGKVSVTWTQDQLEQLSEHVRIRLMEVVVGPFEKACRAAQKAGQNRGTGARDRILEVLEGGGEKAIDAARAACIGLLKDQVDRLATALGSVLRENYEPVTVALQTIVDQQAAQLVRVDKERRARERAAIQKLRDRIDTLARLGEVPLVPARGGGRRNSTVPMLPPPGE